MPLYALYMVKVCVVRSYHAYTETLHYCHVYSVPREQSILTSIMEQTMYIICFYTYKVNMRETHQIL